MRTAMFLRIVFVVAAVASGILPVRAVQAQGGRSAVFSPNVARQYGLEHVWSTQIQVDRSRGRVFSVNPYVSTTKAHTLFEVTYEFGKVTFSETQLDQFRQPLGIEGAKEKAETRAEEIKKLFPESKIEPTVSKRVIPEILLYAVTELGTIHALDGETGRTKWVTTVGRMDHFTTQAAANDRYVGIVNGSTIYILKTSDGSLVWQRQMAGVPTAGPALSKDYIFVPTANGMMESYTLKDSREPAWTFKSTGRTFIQPVTGSNTLAWPSDAGHIYVSSTSPRALRYRMESHHTVDSPPAILGSRLFATSVDGYLYCMDLMGQQDASRAACFGKVSLGYSSSRPPVPIEDVVFAISNLDQLFCVSINTGKERWRTTESDALFR